MSIKSNRVLASYFNRFGATGKDAVDSAPVPTWTEATGGVISDYTDPGPGKHYRAHIFTASGTFDVTQVGADGGGPSDVEYLVVAGGGGGGYEYGGGGGAGGFRSSVSGEGPGGPSPTVESAFPISTSPGSYSIQVGAGGARRNSSAGLGYNGTPSYLGPTIVSQGGGGGGGNPGALVGGAGGSGGGGSSHPTSGPGLGNRETGSPTTPAPNQGYDGGDAPSNTPGGYECAGGGGAGGAGQSVSGPHPPGHVGGYGGIGQVSAIGGPTNDGIGASGPTSGRWFAGGGGGSGYDGLGGKGGGPGGPYAGAGNGASYNPNTVGTDALFATGSGGGGDSPGAAPVASPPGMRAGMAGGSGIVVVRYERDIAATAAKATGGAISYYSGKTIHTFTNSGSLVCPTSISDVEYVIVGGGGGGGAAAINGYGGGGGGAGQYLEGTGVTLPATTYPIVIGAGAKGWTPGSGTSSTHSPQGGPSTFNSIVAGGGGYGGTHVSPTSPPYSGGDGASGTPGGSGSGGGKNGYDNGPAGAGTGNPPGGNPGGSNPPTNCPAGAGGGGAGGAGQDGSPGVAGGKGGVGVQLPTTFRDPAQTIGGPGPGPVTMGWVAGGGGGGAHQPPAATTAVSGAGGGGIDGTTPYAPDPAIAASTPYAGGGAGGYGTPTASGPGSNGTQGTGGGGGGGGSNVPANAYGGNGGSGIVLIAYPT